MSKLSQFLGKSESVKERYLFLQSEVWTVPVSADYRLTALGGGGSASATAAGGIEGERGGDTIINAPIGSVTLFGGEGGKKPPSSVRAQGGAVTSTIPGIVGRKGGDGGVSGNVAVGAGIGLSLVVSVNGTAKVFGSGGSSNNAASFNFGGGGGGGNANGGAGGGIVDDELVFLTAGSTITITIAAGIAGNAGQGLVIFDRY